MKRNIITITDGGAIAVPKNPRETRMTICEIADLLGIYYQTAKRHIRSIEKAGIADGDYRMTCIAGGAGVHPEYYGLDMITAVAFRVGSWQAARFRQWIMKRAAQSRQPPISVIVPARDNRRPD